MILPAIFLALSLSAVLGFISLRRFEYARGVRFFDAERSRLDSRAEELWSGLVTGGIPVLWRNYAKVLAHDLSHLGVLSAVELVRAVERPLAKLSYKMRVSAPRSGSAPVSDFLRTITPDKK